MRKKQRRPAFRANDFSLRAPVGDFALARECVSIGFGNRFKRDPYGVGERGFSGGLLWVGLQLCHNALDNLGLNIFRQFEGITLSNNLDRFKRGVIQHIALPAMEPMLFEFQADFRRDPILKIIPELRKNSSHVIINQFSGWRSLKSKALASLATSIVLEASEYSPRRRSAPIAARHFRSRKLLNITRA